LLHSALFSQVLLPEKPVWLGSDVVAWFMQFSQDSIQTGPNEALETLCMSDEELDVIFLVYICDFACVSM
jgi:hypothetical protein